ncbi:MAG: hypothetical protein IJY09_06985, partial [Lachnospiraceae bacterium]|nr:hypothetical protein [Lachnospiraceae bacterium]
MNEKFVPKHYSILSDIVYFIRFYAKYEPTVLVCCAIEILLGAVIPLFGIYLPKLVVDLVTAGAERGSAAKELLIFTLLMMVAY